MKYQIIRYGLSSYLKPTFLKEEIQALSTIKSVKFIKETDFNPKLPLIILTNSQTQIQDIPCEMMSKKTLILHPNSGYDNFSYKFVKDFKGQIVIGNEIRKKAVSNYILSCLYQHSSNIPFNTQWDVKRQFPRSLSVKNVLIIGKGHIGNTLEMVLKNNEMFTLHFFDPYKGLKKIKKIKYDYIVLVSSLNPTSFQMINSTFLKNYCHSKSCIINPARGELIEELALKNYLQKNKFAFAFLDVFHQEPKGITFFKTLKNVKLSSHIAGVYSHLDQAIIQFEYSVIKDYIQSKNFKKKYKQSLLKNKIHGTILV